MAGGTSGRFGHALGNGPAVVRIQVDCRLDPMAVLAGNRGQLFWVGNFLGVCMTRYAEILSMDRFRKLIKFNKGDALKILTVARQADFVVLSP